METDELYTSHSCWTLYQLAFYSTHTHTKCILYNKTTYCSKLWGQFNSIYQKILKEMPHNFHKNS